LDGRESTLFFIPANFRDEAVFFPLNNQTRTGGNFIRRAGYGFQTYLRTAYWFVVAGRFVLASLVMPRVLVI
jgi:hypothetical protein